MYNLSTQRVRFNRDVRWLGKFHVEGKYVDIPEYSKNNKIQIIQYTANDDKIDEVKETEDAETKSENGNLNKKSSTNYINCTHHTIQQFMILPRFH